MRVCDVCGGRYKDRGSAQVCPFDGTPLRDLPDPLIGRTIAGRYVVSSKIGGGGFGVVYRARHEVLGRDVAVKFLLPELAIDPTNRSRFLREAKAANRIDHEHIIDITDFGETDDGLVYLVMELLEGRTLAAEIEKGPLGLARSVDVALQCASALARAHELDVVHRDIKPENIYLLDLPNRADFVKLLDFGLAQMKGELRLTATGAVFGTPEYMAPEQGRGAPLTGLADLYGLGCVLFEMVAGKPPFTGSTPDLILKHMRETAPPLSSRAPGTPRELDAIVAKLLEKDPRRRHRDAFHLLEELRRVHDAVSARAAAPPPGRRRDVMLPLATVPAPPMAGAPSVHLPPSRASAIQASTSRFVTAQMPAAWERRAHLFRELVARAHGAQPPAWLVPAIDTLAARIAEARAIYDEVAKAAEAASQREQEIRNLRLRLGRAIDELGRDESRTMGLVDDLHRRVGDARARVQSAEAPLGRAIAQLRAAPPGPMSHELAVAVSDAGARASAWLEAEGQLRAAMADIATRERDRDDLRFQISQLKGRLGGMTAEQDVELAALRVRSAELDRRHGELLDDVAVRAARITEHFAAFPALRDAVLAPVEPDHESYGHAGRR